MDFIKGEVSAYCYMVLRGKPAGMVPIQERYLEEIVAIVDECELSTHVEHLADGWATLWIYKYPHILEVLKSLPPIPESNFDRWVLGKLFGYEEAAIQDFLTGTT